MSERAVLPESKLPPLGNPRFRPPAPQGPPTPHRLESPDVAMAGGRALRERPGAAR